MALRDCVATIISLTTFTLGFVIRKYIKINPLHLFLGKIFLHITLKTSITSFITSALFAKLKVVTIV